MTAEAVLKAIASSQICRIYVQVAVWVNRVWSTMEHSFSVVMLHSPPLYSSPSTL